MRIREMRLAAGLTQAELAAKVKVNQTAVSQWERESVLPSCDKLPELADALGCSIDALYGRNQSPA
ncbi:MAG: helix-turn-helix transcriptional regulator [Dysosmobacter sp.]|nr:helix-turn-helix transcriptional regulator [Dysosmobacter sp.]